jgi:hypothetical protein
LAAHSDPQEGVKQLKISKTERVIPAISINKTG